MLISNPPDPVRDNVPDSAAYLTKERCEKAAQFMKYVKDKKAALCMPISIME